MMLYVRLFFEFLKTGLFAVGGGMATIPFLYDMAEATGWFTDTDLTTMLAVSESTPGPIGVNMATYVGYTVAGFWGSVVATVSVCLPALTLMILITKFFLFLKDNRYVKGLIAGMRPVVIGMIGAAALLLMFPSSKEGASFIDGWSWTLFIAAMIAAYRKVNPILLIVLSAAIGIMIYYVPAL